MARESSLRARIAQRRRCADGVVVLDIEPVDGDLPGWGPGAHIDFAPDGGPRRQYSLCGDPADPGRWRIAVLDVVDGRGGSRWIHEHVRAGDEVTVAGPRNHFAFEDAPVYQFVAGGIGITPILPMLRAAEAAGADWRLAYGGRTRASMAFLDELEAYGARVSVLPQDETGLLDLPRILGEPVPGRAVYACGPEPLLAALEAELAGRPGERLHLERFSPKEQVDGGSGAFEVEIASTGARIGVGEGVSIIDALAAAGIEVDFSCREGTCGTCETGVLGGVPDHRDSILTAEEREANDCMLICVGRCRSGPLVLDL
ncbi:PDR/VanB family oxidoreductase [Nocardioides daeguensis]|uniref:PDR/VanB family oxidoreductase n=1 Tax=Nocardioides daeguensis TaxID=908359 RepID=A0ABP6V3M0_9ACTN|nr:PDR/VanB family oxidoreductase [Nocardioides daeguensis]MBV6726523.1 PDR/VanB family oxidoreductase [Nocardioides daeguensis]MCR1772366.1 PDR/VanB family oxidoreductase [Nocardioides daeguensis]